MSESKIREVSPFEEAKDHRALWIATYAAAISSPLTEFCQRPAEEADLAIKAYKLRWRSF